MEEASAGTVVLDADGVVVCDVVLLPLLVVVGSATGCGVAVSALVGSCVSSVLLPPMALSTFSSKSDELEAVEGSVAEGRLSRSPKVPNSAFGPGSFPDDRLLR